jgi:hypothetical protein
MKEGQDMLMLTVDPYMAQLRNMKGQGTWKLWKWGDEGGVKKQVLK